MRASGMAACLAVAGPVIMSSRGELCAAWPERLECVGAVASRCQGRSDSTIEVWGLHVEGGLRTCSHTSDSGSLGTSF